MSGVALSGEKEKPHAKKMTLKKAESSGEAGMLTEWGALKTGIEESMCSFFHSTNIEGGEQEDHVVRSRTKSHCEGLCDRIQRSPSLWLCTGFTCFSRLMSSE